VLSRKNTGKESQSAGPSRSFDSGEAALRTVGEAGVDADERIAEMSLTHPQTNHRQHEELAVQPLFGLEGTTIPRHEIPEEQLSPDVAYRIIHDALMLDGAARLNVAAFLTTWMEPQAQKLMAECLTRT
jgi:hypothetical protein